MSTRFNEKKATAVASLLLADRGGEMSYLKLIKLMYLVDREAIKRWGHPVTGDTRFSMDHGPVLSRTLDLIKGGGSSSNRWVAAIATDSNSKTVKLKGEPNTEALSEAEEALVHAVFKQYGNLTRWELRDLTHELPEYRQTDEVNRRIPITDEQLLVHTGHSEEEALVICSTRAAAAHAKALLGVR